MKTMEYKTRTIFQDAKYPVFNDNYYPLAIDFGYSAVKGISPNNVFCFPSYAKKVNNATFLGTPEAHDIYYRDENGEIWAVGANAQSLVSIDSTNDSLNVLYGRNRYFSEMFNVIASVGIGIGLNKCPGKKPIIQTGLPPAYIKSDAGLLKEALSGKRSFDIKIGTNDWVHYEYSFTEDDIKVMPQPMGTLISAATANNGYPSQIAEELFKKNVLVFDAGFGTLDTYFIKSRMIDGKETFDNLGMKRVLQETADEILRQFQVEIGVSAMQKYLETGEVTRLDRRRMKSEVHDFTNILESSSRKVCMEAMEKVKEIYNYFLEIDYLIVTGGTGAAWSNYIRDYLKDMQSVQIVSGNVNDSLPYIFANVRGYYMFLVNSLKSA